MHKHFRKIVSTVLIAAMLFFAPSMIPARAVAVFPCGFHPIVLLPIDAAFAGAAPYFQHLACPRQCRTFPHGFGPHSLVRLQSSSLASSPTLKIIGN